MILGKQQIPSAGFQTSLGTDLAIVWTFDEINTGYSGQVPTYKMPEATDHYWLNFTGQSGWGITLGQPGKLNNSIHVAGEIYGNDLGMQGWDTQKVLQASYISLGCWVYFSNSIYDNKGLILFEKSKPVYPYYRFALVIGLLGNFSHIGFITGSTIDYGNASWSPGASAIESLRNTWVFLCARTGYLPDGPNQATIGVELYVNNVLRAYRNDIESYIQGPGSRDQSEAFFSCRSGYYPPEDNIVHTVLDGYIDQTSIWKRTLSQSEMSLLYNSGNGLHFNNW